MESSSLREALELSRAFAAYRMTAVESTGMSSRPRSSRAWLSIPVREILDIRFMTQTEISKRYRVTEKLVDPTPLG